MDGGFFMLAGRQARVKDQSRAITKKLRVLVLILLICWEGLRHIVKIRHSEEVIRDRYQCRLQRTCT